MAELVDLVISDGLDVDNRLQICQVRLTGSHNTHACTGEGHLAGGGKFIDHVGVAVFGAEGQNIHKGHKVALKLVDAVSIVPHEHKVRGCGLHGGDTADSLVGVHHALGVGVLGHIPHTLHGGILDKLLHSIHVGSVSSHGNGNKLCPEGLRHLKMPVIARCRAQPLHLLQLAPGLLGVKQAVGIRLGNGIIHKLQTGVAAHEALLRLAP